MSIICLEGASAVGKTTTAENLKAKYNAFVVPEVNLLFERPEGESAEWYFERQIERFEIARKQSETHRLVILDGDPFQPLWYNWTYNFDGRQKLDFIERFYQSKIQNEMIDFPDLYFIFSANEKELRWRKDNDPSRRRSGFERHLKIIEPQRRYFRAMQNFSPNRVCFAEAEAVETNVNLVIDRVSALPKPDESKPRVLFEKMIQWLRENEAQ